MKNAVRLLVRCSASARGPALAARLSTVRCGLRLSRQFSDAVETKDAESLQRQREPKFKVELRRLEDMLYDTSAKFDASSCLRQLLRVLNASQNPKDIEVVDSFSKTRSFQELGRMVEENLYLMKEGGSRL